MLNRKLKPVALAIGAAFAVSAATGLAVADDELFEARVLDGVLLADAHGGEGKCGEGKCGEGKDKGDDAGEGKCGEGKCGEGEGDDEESEDESE